MKHSTIIAIVIVALFLLTMTGAITGTMLEMAGKSAEAAWALAAGGAGGLGAMLSTTKPPSN